VKLLVESFLFKPIEVLNESVDTPLGTDKRLSVCGPFQRYGVANENKRVYPKERFEEQLLAESIFSKRLNEMRVWGEMEHPDKGISNINRTSHIVTEVRVGGNNLVLGKAVILNVPRTTVLKELFALKAPVPVSSRGRGETMPLQDGLEEVQKGYQLETFDFVSTPSVDIALTRPLKEEHRVEEGCWQQVASAEVIDAARCVLIASNSDVVTLAEALVRLKDLVESATAKPAEVIEANKVKALIERRIWDQKGYKKERRVKKKAVAVPRKAQREDKAVGDNKNVVEQKVVTALLPKLLETKAVLAERTKRYNALNKICEALVKRCRASESLAEALLGEAKKKKAKAEEEGKKRVACESVTAGLLKHYHKDGAAFFAEGLLFSSPELERYRPALKECVNAMQVKHIAEGLIEKKQVDAKKKSLPESASVSRAVRDMHPSRLPEPSHEISVLVESAESCRSYDEPNLIQAIVRRERSK